MHFQPSLIGGISFRVELHWQTTSPLTVLRDKSGIGGYGSLAQCPQSGHLNFFASSSFLCNENHIQKPKRKQCVTPGPHRVRQRIRTPRSQRTKMGLTNVHGCVHTECVCATMIADGFQPQTALAHGAECRKSCA